MSSSNEITLAKGLADCDAWDRLFPYGDGVPSGTRVSMVVFHMGGLRLVRYPRSARWR